MIMTRFLSQVALADFIEQLCGEARLTKRLRGTFGLPYRSSLVVKTRFKGFMTLEDLIGRLFLEAELHRRLN